MSNSGFQPLDVPMAKQGRVEKRKGANLPHWTRDGATYSVTFRLADSLPKAAIEELRKDVAAVERKFASGMEALSLEELIRKSKAWSDAYLRMLDKGYGECPLARDEVAEVVAGALKHFVNQRYRLYAWCVMPNHVHAVVQPLEGFDLSGILHGWKSFTATRVNKLLGRTGSFWQRESYDHLIRDEADFGHHVAYVHENPAAAGLQNWKWVG